MRKPDGYDNKTVMSDFKPIIAGTYKFIVLDAKETKSSAGNDMFVLSVDVCEGEFKDYYKKQYKYRKDNYATANWGCVYRREYTTEAGQRYMKGVETAFNSSNPGFKFSWDAPVEQFNGKVFCGLLDYDKPWQNNDGEMVQQLKVLQVRSLDMMGKIEPKGKQEITPPDKDYGTPPPASNNGNRTWMDKAKEDKGFSEFEMDNEELPF